MSAAIQEITEVYAIGKVEFIYLRNTLKYVGTYVFVR